MSSSRRGCSGWRFCTWLTRMCCRMTIGCMQGRGGVRGGCTEAGVRCQVEGRLRCGERGCSALCGGRTEGVRAAVCGDCGRERDKAERALRDAESALLNDAGLPRRPWYKHTIYAPGEYTGYAAVVIPGVSEGIEANDAGRTQGQLDALAAALNRSATILEECGEVDKIAHK